MSVLSFLWLSNSLASGSYLEGTHERPHPLHILTDTDSEQTRAKRLERKSQTTTRQGKIAQLRTGV